MKTQSVNTPHTGAIASPAHSKLAAREPTQEFTSDELRLMERLFPRRKPTGTAKQPATTFHSLAALVAGLDKPRADRVAQLFGGRETGTSAIRALSAVQSVAKRAVR